MARSEQGVDRDLPGLEARALADLTAVRGELELLTFGQDIGGTRPTGKNKATTHVVVVEVGIEHVGDTHAEGIGARLVALGLTLGIDDCCDRAVVDEVATVAEPFGLEDDGFEAGPFGELVDAGHLRG
jgi:hypothetical protein